MSIKKQGTTNTGDIEYILLFLLLSFYKYKYIYKYINIYHHYSIKQFKTFSCLSNKHNMYKFLSFLLNVQVLRSTVSWVDSSQKKEIWFKKIQIDHQGESNKGWVKKGKKNSVHVERYLSNNGKSLHFSLKLIYFQ